MRKEGDMEMDSFVETSRREQLREFTQETTLHGLRFVGPQTHRPVRRVLWVLIVLSCVTAFIYIISQRSLHLRSLPKAVNVDVVYATELPLPAVTICNQNIFRRTKTFEIGKFDSIEDRFKGGTVPTQNKISDKEDCEESFILNEPENLDILQTISTEAAFKNISLGVCKELCRTYFDLKCNSIIYNLKWRSCSITQASWPRSNSTNAPMTRNVYRRSRCNGAKRNLCNFDDGNCFWSMGKASQGIFENVYSSGSSEIGPSRDHTSGYGKYLIMKTDETLWSPYIEAPVDLCLEFMTFGPSQPISIRQIFPEPNYQNIDYNGLPIKSTRWESNFYLFKPGLFQLEITNYQKSSMAIDDIVLGPCSYFERECRVDAKGLSYIGHQNVTSSGEACISWVQAYKELGISLDHDIMYRVEKAGSSCRNFNSDTNGPGCIIANLTYHSCDVPYCACGGDEFQCKNGLCINNLALCDLNEDCPDGEDETEGCEPSLNCTFESINTCGYQNVSTTFQYANTWLRYSGQMRNGHTHEDGTGHVAGHYLYLDSSTTSMVRHQRVSVSSQIMNVTDNPKLTFCFRLTAYTAKDILFPEAMGTLNIYQTFGKFHHRILGSIDGSDWNMWNPYSFEFAAGAETFGILIEAQFGNSFYSDMGVDETELSEGLCAITKPDCLLDEFSCGSYPLCIDDNLLCDGHMDCPNNADEDYSECEDGMSLSCTFNDSFKCGYVDDSNPLTKGWRRLKATDSSIILIKQSMSSTFIKRLTSPFILMPSEQCLTVQYQFVLTTSHCYLSIYMESANSRTILFKHLLTHGLQSNYMHLSYLDLPYQGGQRGRISIEAHCPEGAKGLRMELTKIDATPLSCEENFVSQPAECDFSSHKQCGYLDVSTEGIHWWPEIDGFQVVRTELTTQDREAHLLTPMIQTNVTSCMVYTVRVTTSSGKIGLRVSDFFNDTRLVWGQWFHATNRYDVRIPVILTTGKNRHILSAYMEGLGEVLLKKAAMADAAQCSVQCDLTHRCNDSHCLTPSMLCDFKEDCWTGEDEKGANCILHIPSDGPARDDVVVKPTSLPSTPEAPRPVTDPSMDVIYKSAGHQAEDLIHSCSFAGTRCHDTNVTSAITDYGYCHTLNSFQPGLASKNTGASAGLRLILNIEQYEYMSGPHTDAGVKVFLYNQEEVPFVRDLGFAVGPGEHALVGTTFSQTTSLEKPWGNCGIKELKYGGNYTYSACIRECETVSMLNTCGCRDAYMPGTESATVCSMSRYLECVSSQSELVARAIDQCQCVEPCKRVIYESRLSYAALSSLSVSQILTSDLQQLRAKNSYALDTKQRSTPHLFVEEMTQISRMASAYEGLLNLALDKTWNNDNSIPKNVEKALCLFLTKVTQVDVSTYMADLVAADYQLFEKIYGRVRKTLAWHIESLPVEFDVLLMNLDRGDAIDIDENYTKAVERISNMVVVIEDAIGAYHNSSLQSKSVYHSIGQQIDEDTRKHLPEIMNIDNGDCSKDINNFLGNIIPSIKGDLKTISLELNPDTFSQLYSISQGMDDELTKVQACLDEYVSFLYNMHTDIEGLQQMIQDRIDKLVLCPSTATIDDILDYIDESKNIKKFADALDAIKLKMYTDGTNDFISHNFNEEAIMERKLELETFLSKIEFNILERSRKSIAEIKRETVNIYQSFFGNEIKRSRYKGNRYEVDSLNGMELLKRPQPSITKGIINLESATDRFRIDMTNKFVSYQAFKVISELVGWYMAPLEKTLSDLEMELREQKAQIKSMLDSAKTRFDSYKEKLVLGEDFIRQNFLAIDIYFAQLKYQHTEQIRAYDVESFFSDIGGFMGLLMGASIMTLLEFFDLIIFKLFPPCGRSKNEVKAAKLEKGTPV